MTTEAENTRTVSGDDWSSQVDRQTVEELQREVAQLVLPCAAITGFALILGSAVFQDPLHGSIPGLALLLLASVAYYAMSRSYRLAAWLVVVGFSAIALLILQWYPTGSVACLSVLPFGLAMVLLDLAGGVLTGSLLSLLLISGPRLGLHGPGTWDIPVVLVVLWGVAFLIWGSQRPNRTALAWSWSGYQRAQQLLEEARDRQVELAQIRQGLEQRTWELARVTDHLKVMTHVAEEARRAKEQFVANVSHELRTPLNMIIGFSSLISRSPKLYGSLPPALLADISAIERNSRHLAALVDDVLDLSQVEANRMALQKETVHLDDVIDEAVAAVRSLYEAKGLYLRVAVPSDLSPLRCDRTRTRQVILNLLSNAGRFTEQGEVQVSARQDRQFVIVSVADSGPGIAPKDQVRIFEPFQQLDGSVRRRHGGTGLGLSICKAFVEMQQGRMWVESELGKGATFSFSLPADAPSMASPQPGAARWISSGAAYVDRARHPLPPIPKLKPRYVVVDEEETLPRLLRRYLIDAEILTVRTIEDARREVEQATAEAVVVNTPEAERRNDTVLRISRFAYGTPTISCWVPGRQHAMRRLGVMDYLIKPVTPEVLQSSLERLGDDVRTILLVDDEIEILQLLGRIIRSFGRHYRILRATSGEQALALLHDRRPDAMLLDLVMPGLDGFGLLAQMTQHGAVSNIPVIVISARDPKGEAIVCNSLTVSRESGFSARDLLGCIQSVTATLRLDDRAQPGNARD